MRTPENNYRLGISFTKLPSETLTSLNFAVMPRAGDFVETQNGGYLVKAVVHRTEADLNHEPSISVLLEPVKSFVE